MSGERNPSLWYAKAMEQLVEVVQLLSMARDLPTVVEIVRHAARQLTGADGATFVLRDNGTCFYVEEDAISPLWKGQRFPIDACISGWSMINRQSAVIEDIYADQRIPADAYRPTFVKSLAMVPIRTIDPIGAIGNYWAERCLPTPEQVKVLQALADTTAVALENVRVYEELELRVQQRTVELQSMLDNVQVGVVFSVDGRVARANPKAAEIFRFIAPGVLLDMPLDRLFCKASKTASLLGIARPYLDNNQVFSIESSLLRKDGEEFWAHLIAKSLDPGGYPGGEIWVINDINDAKIKEKKVNELKKAAEMASHAKDSFLATMSHEIRTPLTGMLGMLELMSMTNLDEEQRATLDAAWHSGSGLLRIVSDILDWSKIEEGKLELSMRPTSIEQLLQEVVNTYSRAASAKNLVLSQQTDSHINSTHLVDPLRLSQVLNNFVSNAIKFTQGGGIEVRAKLMERFESGERIRFSVKDTGIGIAKDVQQQLFQRYRQGNADTARMYGGTGLGLAICRRLAELMDGCIELNSEPGQGAMFSIILTLPVCDVPGEIVRQLNPEAVRRKVKPLLAGGVSTNSPAVLAVDDHPINRDMLARQIKLLGLRVKTAENGQKALSMWRDEKFAIIITDCHMPEMDGYSLAKAIRKIESEQTLFRTPIIAWTANALGEEADFCRAAGMDELLVKPANLTQLRAVLAKSLAFDPVENDGTESSVVTVPGEKNTAIDLTELGKVVPDPREQAHVLEEFQAHIRGDYAELAVLLEKSDMVLVGRIAHRMIGSCKMVGAKPLAAVCATIELSVRKEDIAGIRAAAAALADAIEQFNVFLSEFIEERD
ncbi:MAG: ATP-binding protein [Nitrosomonas sp.]|nr:MAG: ATP-binding protein [Nitrosomonas sp.]